MNAAPLLTNCPANHISHGDRAGRLNLGRGGDNRAGTRAENDTPTIPQVAQCPFRAFDMSNPDPRPFDFARPGGRIWA